MVNLSIKRFIIDTFENPVLANEDIKYEMKLSQTAFLHNKSNIQVCLFFTTFHAYQPILCVYDL